MALNFHPFSTAALCVVCFLVISCEVHVRAQERQSLACNCIGPYFCSENNSCVAQLKDKSTESDTGHQELVCIIFKEFHVGVEIVGARCENVNAFDANLLCEPMENMYSEPKGSDVPTKTIVRHCCTTPFCNTREALDNTIARLNPPLPQTVTSPTSPPTSPTSSTSPTTSTSADSNSSSSSTPVYAIVIIVALSLSVILILLVISVLLVLHWYPHCFLRTSKESSIGTKSFPVLDSGSYSDPSLTELLEDSGSGSGLPLLIQRSISGQITLQSLIGKGRFGEVWKGEYKGDDVAVKIFHTKEELSWFHEVEVYQTCLLRHPNILRFIAADNRDIALQMQLWLITEFCELGSLFELLTRQSFDQDTALKLCFTAACGLDHLHTEIVGTQGKPAIAHRDLKSRNILVKADYSCCIADLGLALKYEKSTNVVKEPPRTTVGTRRYLAPEILAENIAVRNFESFMRSDIYSFGLVMWEIGRRAECNGHAEEAQLPYFDLIPSDPTLEEVWKLVCVEQRRPSLPNTWSQHEMMTGLAKIIRQCWLHEAEARLTSLRIKKSLANLMELRKENKGQEQT